MFSKKKKNQPDINELADDYEQSLFAAAKGEMRQLIELGYPTALCVFVFNEMLAYALTMLREQSIQAGINQDEFEPVLKRIATLVTASVAFIRYENDEERNNYVTTMSAELWEQIDRYGDLPNKIHHYEQRLRQCAEELQAPMRDVEIESCMKTLMAVTMKANPYPLLDAMK